MSKIQFMKQKLIILLLVKNQRCCHEPVQELPALLQLYGTQQRDSVQGLYRTRWKEVV